MEGFSFPKKKKNIIDFYFNGTKTIEDSREYAFVIQTQQ